MKIKIHQSFIFLLIISILTGLFYKIIVLLIIISLHELGHIYFLQKYQREVDKITLLPIGAIINYKNDTNTFLYQELLIAIAGILVNILLLIIFKIFKINNDFYYFNLYILLFNILPIYPLDGGRIIEILLCKIFKFKKVIKFNSYLSLFFLFIIIIYSLIINLNLNLIIISIFLIIQNVLQIKYLETRYYLFLLNKYLYPNKKLKEKQIKKIDITLIKSFYKGVNNYIKGKKKITEEIILNKEFINTNSIYNKY